MPPTTETKPKKTRSPNMLAASLANEIVRLRASIARHEAGLSEAKDRLVRLESLSDPAVLAGARALLGASNGDAKATGKADGRG